MVSDRDRGAQLGDEHREVLIIEMAKPGQIAEVAGNALTARFGEGPLGDVQAIVPTAHRVQHLVMPGRQQDQAHAVGIADAGDATTGRIGHLAPLAVEVAGGVDHFR